MSKLVLDVGMYEGSDTQQYLKQGYDVVAVEANPANVAIAEERFEREIDTGRLRILHCAVAARSGTVTLHVPVDSPGWATLSQDHIDRSATARGKTYRAIEVPARTFQSILAETGVPYYIKVDIEGSDILCVRALSSLPRLPRFFSMESRVGFKGYNAMSHELQELHRCGYFRVAYIDQRHNEPLTSGPFGECIEATWLTFDQARLRAAQLHIGNRVRERLRRPLLSWYDLHAGL